MRLILPFSSSNTSQHGASIFLTRGRQSAEGKLQWPIVRALQVQWTADAARTSIIEAGSAADGPWSGPSRLRLENYGLC